MMSALKRLLEEGKALTSEASGFLASRWKLLAALTLAFFASIMSLVLLVPPQYTKEISLTVTPRIGEVQERLGQQKLPDKEVIGRTALGRLKERAFGPVEVVSKYDASAGKVRVSMHSRSRASLEEAVGGLDESLDESFRKRYEKNLTSVIRTRLAGAEASLASNRTTLTQIDAVLDYNRRVGLSSPDPAVVETATSTVQKLETQRADLVASIEQKEETLDYFEKALKDPGAAADEAVEVAVSSESEVRQTGTYSSPAVAVALFAIVAAVTMVLRVAAGRGEACRNRRSHGRTPAGTQGSAS